MTDLKLINFVVRIYNDDVVNDNDDVVNDNFDDSVGFCCFYVILANCLNLHNFIL